MKYKKLKFGDAVREKSDDCEIYYTHWHSDQYRVSSSHFAYGCKFKWECPGPPECSRKHTLTWYGCFLKDGKWKIIYTGKSKTKAFSECRKHAAQQENKK